MTDLTCLADGLVAPVDFAKTGLNSNEIVVGPTGCGKTFSNGYSRILNTYDSSVVIPISKRVLYDQFKELFEERGYQVLCLDFANPDRCETGYDPIDYVTSEEDIIQCARNFIGNSECTSRTGGNIDPYWNDSGTSILAAEIALTKLNAETAGRQASFADVIELHRCLDLGDDSRANTSLDPLFLKAEELYPGNQATQLWKTIMGLGDKTASCIYSIVNNALDKVFTKNIIEMTRKTQKIDFSTLGRQKTALFIITSPVNQSLLNFINIMYANMIKCLFETAEQNANYRLDVPVHILCDDFACSGKIADFEKYISIFRAVGLSVTLLLQNEAQLIAMYGEQNANTIINNCDTYVYMGGQDITTCTNVARRADKSVHEIFCRPLEQVIVFRRGSKPFYAKRYQTLQDPEYIKLQKKFQSRERE